MLARSFLWFLICLLFVGCSAQPQQANINISIAVDAVNIVQSVVPGISVQTAIDQAGIVTSQQDRISPPVYTLLSDGMVVTITRIHEEFEARQVVIPFDRQELHNESLPAGEIRLVQAGENGLREMTVRRLFEDGIEKSVSVVGDNIIIPPMPEIVMIGVQSPFAPIEVPGKLAYLSGGNAWIMETTTSNRRPLVTTGDLDGHILSLSPDGNWLLFTRESELPAEEEINTLWVVYTESQSPKPINLRVSNVIHFADWQPGRSYIIAYSTVEPRMTAPGWQANNDLHLLQFSGISSGKPETILETNAGGIYGWWGMSFAWSPDGSSIAYARPDGIGLIDLEENLMKPILGFTPFNTHSDWAWVPGIAWSPESQSISLVLHAEPSGLISPEESPTFDLAEASLVDNIGTSKVKDTGMFSYPSTSGWLEGSGDGNYMVAFLQAVFPAQSATSRYVLKIMNSDGSDLRQVFPGIGQTGLQPQTPQWAPIDEDFSGKFIGIIYDGNIWIVDAITGQSQQIIGDGSVTKLDWQ